MLPQVYDVGANTWKAWMETVEPQKLDPDAEYTQVMSYGSMVR